MLWISYWDAQSESLFLRKRKPTTLVVGFLFLDMSIIYNREMTKAKKEHAERVEVSMLARNLKWVFAVIPLSPQKKHRRVLFFKQSVG